MGTARSSVSCANHGVISAAAIPIMQNMRSDRITSVRSIVISLRLQG
jgi:hypothetical protein